MSENAQKPRIRFKGFSDAWEQRKLGELSNIIDPHPSHRAPEEEEIGIPFVGIGDVDIDGNINYEKVRKVNESIYDEHHRRYDLAIPSLGIGRVASLGKVIRLRDDIGKYAVSPTMSIMQFTENSNIDFLYAAMNTEMFQRQFALQSNGSTRQSVGIQDLRVTEVSISPNGEEQKEIGAYFRNLDNLITLHQRKYDKLVAVKKSLLEKMFPADGETVPKIRFKGFSDAWEQRKLWQLTIWDKKFNGVESYKQVKVIKYPYVLADVFSQIEDTSGTVRLLSTGSYIGYTTKEKAGNNLCYGEIVAIPWGGVANIKYYNGFFVTADNRIATSSNTQVLSNRYLHWWMESNITQIQSTYRGASIQHPSMNDILSLSIYLPSIEEQEKISNKLDTLDNLITLHQRQLEKLKNIKSALLEKMFV